MVQKYLISYDKKNKPRNRQMDKGTKERKDWQTSKLIDIQGNVFWGSVQKRLLTMIQIGFDERLPIVHHVANYFFFFKLFVASNSICGPKSCHREIVTWPTKASNIEFMGQRYYLQELKNSNLILILYFLNY